MPNHDVTHAPQHKNEKRTPKKVSANEAARALRQILERVSATDSMLHEGRGSGVPVLMRNGATNAEAFLVRLIAAREALERTFEKTGAGPMRELLDRSELDELQLRTGIVRNRMQADDIDRANSGPLGQLPQGELQTSPDAIKRQARENTPLGLCDDPLMEDTLACPLDGTLRSANREIVRDHLEAIGSNWHAAVQSVYTDARFKSLLEHAGASSIRDMLLSLALGWVGGAIAGAAFDKVGGRYAVKAAMRQSAVSLEQMRATFAALGKKGGEKLAGKIPKQAPVDGLAALTGAFAQLASDWTFTAKQATRQLPDAALTALASGLSASPFSVEYFRARLNVLMTRYQDMDTSMGKRGWAAAQTMPAWVVHPRGDRRMALVREQEEEVTSGHGKASEVASQTTGRFVFVKWVDRSLESAALDIGRQRHLVTTNAFTTTDARWAGADSLDLSLWHANPAVRDDVAMFSDGGQ